VIFVAGFLAVAAAALAYRKVGGWGWFLFAAVVIFLNAA
jgi:hypothetical protein